MFRPRSIGLLLAFITLLVFLPATSSNFINYDDQGYVTENSVVQNGLTWAGVKWAFTGIHVSNWHPLTWLSHMVDCELFRLNPSGHHLVNILFHAINAALLFWLLFRLTEQLWPAAFIAALFAWHPLHVESVVWIAERKDVLSTFFTLLTLLSYIRYAKRTTESPSRVARAQLNATFFYWLAGFFFILALLAKPMPVTLPVVMLLLDYWPLHRVADEKWPVKSVLQLTVEKWPFLLLSAASCLVTLLAQHNAMSTLAGIPMSYRLENVLTAYAGYLWKMVWPVNLAIFYPFSGDIPWQSVAESVIVLTGISIFVWRERNGSPWLLVGWLWFLITLVPVIGLVQVGGQAMADRYTYFPLVGIFGAGTFLAVAMAGRFHFLKRAFIPVAVLILGGCVAFTENQICYWHDSESLFVHALTVQESDMAQLCLGAALHEQGRESLALRHYFMALRINPGSAQAWANIGRILADQNRNEAAAEYYRVAVKRKIPYPSGYDNYGILLVRLGRFDEAMKQFSAAAQMDGAYAPPHFLMGRMLLLQGRDTEAVPHLRKALQLAPNDVEMILFTAGVLAADENQAVRNGAEARTLAERANKLSGGQQSAVLDVLAMACAENGQFDEAVSIQQQALKLLETNGFKEDIAPLRQRLQHYQNHQPWRDSFKNTEMKLGPEKI